MTLWLCATALFGQDQAGGHAASFLRRVVIPDEIGRAGAYTPFSPSSLSLFTNSSALARLQRPTVAVTASLLPFGQRLYSGAGAFNVGDFGGLGIGVLQYNIGNIPARSGDASSLGTTGASDLALMVGGGMQIGPGSIGATMLFLHQDIQGVAAGGANGYAIDISGTINFQNQILFAFSMASLAGEMTTVAADIHQIIPWQSRLSATYIYALDEGVETLRADPSGLPTEHRSVPDSYILGVAELKTSQFDSTIVSLAIEAVPLPSIPVGLRVGFNTRGDISFGLTVGVPTEITRDLRFGYAALREVELGEISQHVSLTFGF